MENNDNIMQVFDTRFYVNCGEFYLPSLVKGLHRQVQLTNHFDLLINRFYVKSNFSTF